MINLAELIMRGGLYYDVEGDDPKKVIHHIIERVALPAGLDRKTLEDAVQEREDINPTALGFGIALPHPRQPVADSPDAEFVTLAGLKQPVNWRALDAEPVFGVCLIVSSSARNHLKTLSRVLYFRSDLEFRKLLRENADKDAILNFINEVEKGWK
jgi:PTS system nitrogen regulatory IIA component